MKEKIVSELNSQLNCDTVFSVGPFGFSEAVVVTWIIMAALVIFSIIITRNLKVKNPGKAQLCLESLLTWVQNFLKQGTGSKGACYVEFLMTVFLYLAVANLISLFGFKPPTKDLNITAGLAVTSLILIEVSGIRAKGLKGKLKAFAEPVPVVLPINILEIVMRPVSLCMRLFGNVLGSFVVMELLKTVVPLVVPVPFCCYFDIFDGLLQAYVFVFLTSLFIGETVE